jgi:cellulose synthase/poly-beta-1,6-N-acetylglucosamine synthase-like glycosyltransferase
MIDVYMTSFFRKDMTQKAIDLLMERTAPGSYQIHIFDNNSDKETRMFLYYLLDKGLIVSLHLDSRNTGCLYNKAVFHTMTETKCKYYMITDNDIMPPKLTPDWLSQMMEIMDAHPELAFLTPQFPPIQFMSPQTVMKDIVYCQAVGNALKLVRREALDHIAYEQVIGAFGDDGLLSKLVRERGWKVAFCRKIFALHAGQCENWGYKSEEIDKDPRKAGYGPPFVISTDPDTFEPTDSRFVL